MLQPSKTKFRKQQKGRIRGISYRGSSLCFGDYGIVAVECGLVSAKQIETMRILISKILGKVGKMWIRIFPDKVITRKAAGVRMGSGKGDPEFWAAVVRPGVVILEINNVEKSKVEKIVGIIANKLSVKIRFVYRKDLLFI